MDTRIRRNEICVIGQPQCDFVFSSTRSCFIGYDFIESPLEVETLKTILESKDVQVTEAGEDLALGDHAFCSKICSKIITSQFCIVILNNSIKSGQEMPNPNVYMEYGLMKGFNKMVIPFQREDQNLPFNVAALDTIKYEQTEFKRKAQEAVEHAIEKTQQDNPQPVGPDQIIRDFILSRGALVSPLDTDGERNIYRLGEYLGFNLLNDFPGSIYTFFGNFTALEPKIILRRLRLLDEILVGRRSGVQERVTQGFIEKKLLPMVENLFKTTQIWVAVTSSKEKDVVLRSLEKKPLSFTYEIFHMDQIREEVDRILAQEDSLES